MTDAGEVTVKIKAELDDLEAKLSDAKGQVEDFADQAEDKGTVKLKADTGELEGKLDEAKGQVQSFADEASSTGKVQLDADASGVESGASQASSAVGDFSSSAIGSLAAIAAAVYVVVEAFMQLGEVVQLAAHAEEMATQTAIKTGETTAAGFQARSKEIQGFARDYAVETGDSTEEINKSLQKLYGYGFTGVPTEAVMEPFHALSHAISTDMMTATTLIEGSQIRFGKTMEDNTHIADVWAKAINNSNLDPAVINIESVSMAAKEGGMSLEDMAATMAVASAKSLPDPTMALRMGVMALSAIKDPVAEYDKKTGKVKWTGVTDGTEALKKFGMSASSVKAEPLLDTLEKMHDAGASLADFQEIFGSRTGMLLKNISDNVDEIRSLSDEMEHTTGTAKVMASVVGGEFQESWNRAGQAIEGIKEKIGTDLMADIRPLLDIFSTSGYDAIMAFIEGLGSGDFSGVAAKMDKFAGELGKNIASQIGEAFDIARGLTKWDWSFLTGKTSLDAFLKPIEQVFRAEFGLIAAEMKLKMLEGSQGAGQAIYGFHDAAVRALAGVYASVLSLADAFSSILAGAIQRAADALNLDLKLNVTTTTTSATQISSDGGGGTAAPSGAQKYENIATDYEKAHHDETVASADAWSKESQRLAGLNKIDAVSTINTLAEQLRSKGIIVEIAPSQLMGAGYTAQVGVSDITGAVTSFTTTMDNLPTTIGKPIADYFDSIPNIWSKSMDDWGAKYWPKIGTGIGIPQPQGITGLSYVEDTAKSSSKTALNTEDIKNNWDLHYQEGLAKFGGEWGKYEPDLTEARAEVALATGTLEEVQNSFRGKIDKTGDSLDKTSGDVDNLGQSCKNCAQANQESTQATLGFLRALTATEELGPESFRAAVEDLGTMYQQSFVGPTALYALEFPELMGKDKTARLGAINQLSDAEYEAYYNQVLGGAGLSGKGYVSSTMISPQGGGDEWLGYSESLQPEKVTYINAEVVADTSKADASISTTQAKASEPQRIPIATDTAAFDQSWNDIINHTGKFAPDPKTGDMFRFDYGLKPESTLELEGAISKAQKQASEGQVMEISASTGSAENEIVKLGSMAGEEKQMPIKLGGYESARAKIDDLTQDEIKYIYIITVKTTVGGGGWANANATWDVTGSLAGVPGIGSPVGEVGVGLYSFQNEAFVPRPTLAVVGDRPGGEYVLSAERMERLGRGGGGIQITYAPTINGSGLSAGELEYLLDRQREKLIDDAAQEAAFRQWR